MRIFNYFKEFFKKPVAPPPPPPDTSPILSVGSNAVVVEYFSKDHMHRSLIIRDHRGFFGIVHGHWDILDWAEFQDASWNIHGIDSWTDTLDIAKKLAVDSLGDLDDLDKVDIDHDQRLIDICNEEQSGA